jgi:hypothetical protein
MEESGLWGMTRDCGVQTTRPMSRGAGVTELECSAGTIDGSIATANAGTTLASMIR